ncbi:hypothetical protein ABZP36_012828 [Zizania latifolia]
MRLACVLKIGHHKTSIKNLAGELGLDRALVIEFLCNPPPKLLLMSDSFPDEAPSKPEIKEIEPSPVADDKRLKKVQLETLERVYLRSKCPTFTLFLLVIRNTMISSIVQVTNLPWKTIIKWFEDRRERDGLPDHRVRSLSETIAS